MKRDTHYRFTVNAAQDAAELMIYDDIGESWFGGSPRSRSPPT